MIAFFFRYAFGIKSAVLRKIATLLVAAFLSSAARAADLISGIPVISDGDTLEIGATTIRLASIDAPESDQVCLNANQQQWTCGVEARDRLSTHIAGRSIDCTPIGSDDFKRTLAKCTIGGEDLNRWMVQEGWALAFVRYSKEYVRDEEAARAAGRGLWTGAFYAPWDWRHRNCQTVVLGRTSVPISAPKQLLCGAVSGQNCPIKGNISRKGEKIYFRPGQLDYARLDMSKPNKQCFQTEDEAKAAGYRAAAR